MKNKGFTLPELMIVVLIMGVLIGISTPMWLNAKARANARACQSNLEIIRAAEHEWALDNPGDAIAAYTINETDVTPYIDGGYASLSCEESGTYSMPAIDANGNIPNPTCSYAATNPDHAIQ